MPVTTPQTWISTTIRRGFYKGARSNVPTSQTHVLPLPLGQPATSCELRTSQLFPAFTRHTDDLSAIITYRPLSDRRAGHKTHQWASTLLANLGGSAQQWLWTFRHAAVNGLQRDARWMLVQMHDFTKRCSTNAKYFALVGTGKRCRRSSRSRDVLTGACLPLLFLELYFARVRASGNK